MLVSCPPSEGLDSCVNVETLVLAYFPIFTIVATLSNKSLPVSNVPLADTETGQSNLTSPCSLLLGSSSLMLL